MQAMAAQQAARQSAEALDPYPFSTLAVWRDKLQQDLGAAAGMAPGHCVRLLVQQSKDVEQAVLGCLKDSLHELHEGVVWGLLGPPFEQQQRQMLLNAAANELHTDKQLCVQLAREYGVLREFAARLKPTLADYERAGELQFGLLVWRANVRRDASLAGGDAQLLEQRFRQAYCDALRLIRRCGSRSQQFWAAQQVNGAPTEQSKQRLYRAAVQKVQNTLLELGRAYPGVDAGNLQRLLQELSDPEAAELEEGEAAGDHEAEEEAEGEEEGQGGSPEGAGRQGVSRGSSDESESSALGL